MHGTKKWNIICSVRSELLQATRNLSHVLLDHSFKNHCCIIRIRLYVIKHWLCTYWWRNRLSEVQERRGLLYADMLLWPSTLLLQAVPKTRHHFNRNNPQTHWNSELFGWWVDSPYVLCPQHEICNILVSYEIEMWCISCVWNGSLWRKKLKFPSLLTFIASFGKYLFRIWLVKRYWWKNVFKWSTPPNKLNSSCRTKKGSDNTRNKVRTLDLLP